MSRGRARMMDYLGACFAGLKARFERLGGHSSVPAALRPFLGAHGGHAVPSSLSTDYTYYMKTEILNTCKIFSLTN